MNNRGRGWPRIYLTMLGLLIPLYGYTASQGSLSVSSQGDVDIAVTLGLSSRITGLVDINLGVWSGSGNLAANDNVCVGLLGTANYIIRAEGDGDGVDINAFALNNGTDYLPYRVYFNDQTGLIGRVEMTAGLNLTGQSVPNGFVAFLNALIGCVANNANISLEIESTNLASVSAGAYSGLLTLILIPE